MQLPPIPDTDQMARSGRYAAVAEKPAAEMERNRRARERSERSEGIHGIRAVEFRAGERPIRVYGGSRGHRIDAINVNTGLRVRNDESESLKDRREVRDPRVAGGQRDIRRISQLLSKSIPIREITRRISRNELLSGPPILTTIAWRHQFLETAGCGFVQIEISRGERRYIRDRVRKCNTRNGS